jgi:hypothetical protein
MAGFLNGQAVRAQSTIAGVPSTDVVPKGHVYMEFDFITNYGWARESAFRSYSPRGVVGVARNVEAGVNVGYTELRSGVRQPIEIQPNVKWQFFNNEAKGMAASVGCVIYVPVARRAGSDTFGMCYTTLSKRVRGKYGPRLTTGVYSLFHRDDGTGAKAGVIAGYEQPLGSRLSFVTDWFSGRNRFGYVTPGFSFATTRRSSLFSGYSIGNAGRRNHAFFAFYGMTF